MSYLAFIIFVCFSGITRANEFDAERAEVLALGELTTAPAMMEAEGFRNQEGIRPIFYDGLDYEGKATKVFAWLGIPKSRTGKVPGIVLVHGGGGTAFRQWVEKWNERGFAAIAIAHEGQVERRQAKRKWAKHQWPGPWRRGHYKDSAKPLQDQWMYHAVTDTILANSLLRALPEVDNEKVGIMGVSWGGVITSTVMGIDSRFAFAIPTYGCGHMADVRNHWGAALGKNTFYREVWDPVHYLPRAKTPTLWFSWPEDHHFPLNSQAASYRAMRGEYMVALLPGMKHSTPASWNPPDSYAFAKSVVRDGEPWARQLGSQVTDGSLLVTFASSKPLNQAVLISTTDTGFTGNRKWVQSTAKLVRSNGSWKVSAKLPKATTACFVNVKASELTVSSEYVELESATSAANATTVTNAGSAEDAWLGLVGKRFAKRPEFAYVRNDPTLPNVLIYGDSISIHYTQRVRQKLQGKANVYRLYCNGQHSGAFIPKMTRMHNVMRGEQLDAPWSFQWDVIQFNVGLHDLKYLAGNRLDKVNGKQVTSIEPYKENLSKIALYLQKLAPNAKLIFATTTPVPAEEPGRFAGDAQKYNDAALKALREHPKITINDLFTFTKPNHSKWWVKPSDVHYNATGRNALGDEVARVIQKALSELPLEGP